MTEDATMSDGQVEYVLVDPLLKMQQERDEAREQFAEVMREHAVQRRMIDAAANEQDRMGAMLKAAHAARDELQHELAAARAELADAQRREQEALDALSIQKTRAHSLSMQVQHLILIGHEQWDLIEVAAGE